MQQQKSYLPSNAVSSFFTESDGTKGIEIAVPFNDDLVDLGYPRLIGTFKMVNGTWSATFIIDFLLLENDAGDYVFEVETVPINRNQFKSKEAMIVRLERFYGEYYCKTMDCTFDADNDAVETIRAYFGGAIDRLKIADTNCYINL